MNLAVAFAECAGTHAEKPAIFYGEQEISFAELHAQSLKFAALLQTRFAVKPGDRVALVVEKLSGVCGRGVWRPAGWRGGGADQ